MGKGRGGEGRGWEGRTTFRNVPAPLYTDRASRARESSVTNMSAITDHAVEENHVIDCRDKAKVVDREAQRQTRWTRGTLDQEDTDLHESRRRILPAEPHMGPSDVQVMYSIELKTVKT